MGYGAEPDGCVELARETCAVCLAGNHDLVVTQEIPISDFSSSAAAAALWTREHITEESLEFLRGRPASDPEREPGLYHGSPRDPVWEYVLSSWQADECMDLMRAAWARSAIRTWRSGSAAPPAARSTAARRRLRRGRSVRRRVAHQPRQRRPAARW